MSHHHDHDHHHSHESQDALSFEEKLIKRLEHWIKHNNDHVEGYKEWTALSKEKNMPEVSRLLNQVADMSIEMSRKFEAALELVKGK